VNSTARAERFPCFDGLRAIAAGAVLVTHVSFVTTANRVIGGSYFARFDSGVSIFFVISGFLLYRPFVSAAMTGGDGPDVGPFFWRRALRIFPAYWLAASLIALAFDVKPWDGLGDALAHLALVHIYDADTVVSGPISQAWSLGTEITFYAALPLLGLAARAIGRRTGGAAIPQVLLVASLIAASLLYRWAVVEHAGASAPAMATWLPGYMDQFGLGMLLAITAVELARPRATTSRMRTIADARWLPLASWALAFASLSVAAFVIDLPTSSLDYSVGQQMGRQVTYGLWGLFLVAPAVVGPQDRGLIRALLRSPIARVLGLISYGVYLWHQFFIDRFLRWTGSTEFGGNFGSALAFVAAGAVVAATLSYVLVERPILQLKHRPPRLRRATPRPAIDAAAVVTAGARHEPDLT